MVTFYFPRVLFDLSPAYTRSNTACKVFDDNGLYYELTQNTNQGGDSVCYELAFSGLTSPEAIEQHKAVLREGLLRKLLNRHFGFSIERGANAIQYPHDSNPLGIAFAEFPNGQRTTRRPLITPPFIATATL